MGIRSRSRVATRGRRRPGETRPVDSPAMFTGIVETVGVITEVEETDGGRRFRIKSETVADSTVGSSVAVAGVCLTITGTEGDEFMVELVSETIRRTSLGRLGVGERVNLERAMSASGRFDGHIVQGHVDGVGRVTEVVEEGEGRRLTVGEIPATVAPYVVEKGSITVEGVSLTVAALTPDGFEVALIPHTLGVTTLGALQTGDLVNLEADILAKYLERLLVRK